MPIRKLKIMVPEKSYVDYLYHKYEGRVSIGVGYDHNLSEIYPFGFKAGAQFKREPHKNK